MLKQYRYILIMCLAIALLTACKNTETPVPEAPETYGINAAPLENSEQQDNDGSGYEIDDMLPRPSDDTLIISVEEAEEIMNNRKNTDADVDAHADANSDTNTNADAETGTEQKKTGSEYEIDDMLPRPSDDTLIMSVEEAEAFMNNKANTDTDADKESSEETN